MDEREEKLSGLVKVFTLPDWEVKDDKSNPDWFVYGKDGSIHLPMVIDIRLDGELEVEPASAAMVGDTLHEDVEGARAVGMRAVLLDREGRHPEVVGRLEDLRSLAAALGLE